MTKLKVGIIGLGIGERHIEAYAKHPGCEIALLCDFNPEKAAEIKPRYPQYKVCETADTVLGSTYIDVVSIASYDNYHYEQIVKALNANKHVVVEKPFCLSRHEAEDIGTLLNMKNQLSFSSNLVLCTVPRFQSLRQEIVAGKLGKLYHIEGDCNYGRIEKLTQGWRGQIDFYSVVYGGGVHLVDLFLWLTNQRITEVQANATNIATKGSQFRYNDTVTAIIKFENGMTGKIGSNFACVYPHYHKLSVYGSAGTFEQNMVQASWYFSREKGYKPLIDAKEYPGNSTRGELITSFIDNILFGSEPMVSPAEVFDSMSVCFAIEDAAKTGEKVKVSYMEVYK